MILHGIQFHKLTQRPLHVDLFAVQMTEELTVDVQLVGDGVAPAAENGGTLVHPVSTLKVRALPGDLPETLHYDLSAITTYDTVVTVADLIVPAGVTIQAEGSEIIARVLAPRVEEVAAAAAEVEAEEPSRARRRGMMPARARGPPQRRHGLTAARAGLAAFAGQRRMPLA